MEREQIQNFLDEAEIMISGIRRGILVYTQADASVAVLDIPVQRVGDLIEAAAETGLENIAVSASLLEKNFIEILSSTSEISRDSVLALLDQVSVIESQLATIRMSEESFSVGLNELVDLSFEKLGNGNFDAGKHFDPDFCANVDNDQHSTESDSEFEIDAELLEIFAAEADELISNIDANLQILATAPEDKDAI